MPREWGGKAEYKLEDLKGKKVGTSQGSNYDAMATDAGAIIVHYPGANEIFGDLKAGRIDAAINDRLFVAEYLLKNPNSGLKAAGPVFNTSQNAFALRKGNSSLVEAVNKALAGMKDPDPFTAAFSGLIFHFGAYISETIRARSGRWIKASGKPVLLWASTSLASVVTVPELTRSIEEISSARFVFMPLFLELALFYWIMVLLMTRVQVYLERRLSMS
ncbi:hypothetical protein [Paradesulfitobacterium aromaticivorans]